MPDSTMTSNLVQQHRDNDVLVLTIQNPPVNAFSHGVPEGLHAGLDLAEKDDSLKGVVIIGGGRTFIAGADIKTFNLPREQAPDLRGFISRLAQYRKPTVAAIHGTALGGGLEVTMACNYRIVLEGSKLGLPEVKLGVLPGSGGTQRLPRVVGVEKALDMMLSGQPISASEAKELGLVDQVATGERDDLLREAVALVRQHADVDANQLPRISERSVQAVDPQIFTQRRKAIQKTHKGQLSPRYIIDLVEIATTKAFTDGWAAEARLFVMAKDSPQARGLRRLFFAERQINKVPDVAKDTPVQEVKHVGVIGAGTMGAGIAMSFLAADLNVSLIETTQEALDRGLSNIQKTFQRHVDKGRWSEEQRQERLKRLHTSLSLSDLAATDLVIEAVFEDMQVKKELMQKLSDIVRPDCILATNTSTLNVDQIAAAASHPERVVGLHFFSPAHIMKLLEIVRAEKTSASVLATSLKLAKKLKKIAVVVGICYGFVGNRMLYAYREQASTLVLDGAAPEQVDTVIKGFGLPMGPFEMADMAGLDIGHAARAARARQLGQDAPDDWLDRVVKLGRKGQKTAAGIYDYPAAEGGGRPQPVPSAEVQQLLSEYRHEKEVCQRDISDEEISDRLMLALVNEGSKILEEGIALRASDIDVIYVYGYGFPAYRGGPMGYANELGLDVVVSKLEQYGLRPTALLHQLANEDMDFAQYDAETAKVRGQSEQNASE